jgi:hypothetical protein
MIKSESEKIKQEKQDLADEIGDGQGDTIEPNPQPFADTQETN